MNTARAWGLGGLLVFEATVLYFTLRSGFSQFSLWALAAGALLGFALWQHARGAQVARWAYAALALVTLARALVQTVGNPAPLPILPSYLVPLGFGLLAWGRGSWQGPAAIALGRSWFVLWYFTLGFTPLVLGNLAGAAGAWAWAAGARGTESSATLNEEPGVAPP